jgi:hypothetical protein
MDVASLQNVSQKQSYSGSKKCTGYPIIHPRNKLYCRQTIDERGLGKMKKKWIEVGSFV